MEHPEYEDYMFYLHVIFPYTSRDDSLLIEEYFCQGFTLDEIFSMLEENINNKKEE